MAERKKTPNILADLLGDKIPEADEETDLEADALQQGVTPPLGAMPKSPPSSITPSNAAREDDPASLTLPGEAQKAVKKAKQEAVLPAKRQDSETGRQQGAASPVLPARGDEGEETEGNMGLKVKVTFYLSEEAVDLLEEAQRKLRRLARGTGKIQSKAATSKSALLEEALKLACADLEAAGAQSQLARVLS